MTNTENKVMTSEWLPLVGMTVAAFMFNTSEFMPIGLLMDIAADFHMTEPEAGRIITIYAYVVMLLSLPLMVLASRLPLRQLLLGTIALFATAHVFSAVANGFIMLLLSRIGVACAHAIFWSIAAPVAVRLVRPQFQALAMGMIVTGTAIAVIIGLPLGRIVGLYIGWRMTFLSLAILAGAVLCYMFFIFPALPQSQPFTFAQLPQLLRNKVLLGLFMLSLLIPTAYYTAYSYIEPFLAQVAAMSEGWITFTLILFGAAGLLGSMAFSRFYERWRRHFLTGATLGIALVLFLLYPAASQHYLVLLACACWGIMVTAFNVAGQAEIIRATDLSSSPIAMSIYSGIYNLGIGSGTWLGGLLCSQLSVDWIGVGGGVIALAGCAWCHFWLLPRIAVAKA